MYVNTASSNLNVRNAPGGAVIGSLARGTQVVVYSEQNDWSQIGPTSWVSSQYLSSNIPANNQPTTKTMYVKTSGSNLNVRNTPNGNVVSRLTNGTKVTVYEENNGWSRIGDSQWVASQYLAAAAGQTQPSIPNTVGQTKVLKGATIIYSNSNLSGTQYNYKAGTSVIIMANISSTVDKVKVKMTGRVGYVNKNSYR